MPNALAALIVVALAWLAARLAATATRQVLRQVTPYDEIKGLLARVARAATFGAGVFVALGMLELDKTVTSLIAGAGILTLVAGLAFQLGSALQRSPSTCLGRATRPHKP